MASPSKHPPSHDHLYWGVTLVIFFAVVGLIIKANNNLARDYFFSIERLLASTPPSTHSSVRVTIDFGNGTVRAFEGRVEEVMTALAVLRASAKAGDLAVETSNRGELLLIGEVENDGAHAWTFAVNGKNQGTIPGIVDVSPGDQLQFAFRPTGGQ
jgi:hypothetical protein